jgi:hypothetical protein
MLRTWKIRNISAAHFIRLPEHYEEHLVPAYAPVGSAGIHPDPHVYALRYNSPVKRGETGFAAAGWEAPFDGRLLVLYGRKPDGQESLWQVVVPDDLLVTFQDDRSSGVMR